jgi:cytochrome c oxidase cbb3-type subunit I/II
MPAYPWLFEDKTDMKSLPGKIATQVRLGVPWPAMKSDEILDMAQVQAMEIADSLIAAKVYLPDKPELQGLALRDQLAASKFVAMTAYLQKIGAYREVKKDQPAEPSMLNPDSHRKPEVPAATIQAH